VEPFRKPQHTPVRPQKLEFLYEQGTEAEQVYVFKHALTQDVAYDTMLLAHRQILHEATAEAWAPGVAET